MSEFAERIKAHYAGIALRKIEVPEWGTTIYVRPATVGQSSAIMAEPDQWHQACKLIQVRAKKEDGTQLFDEADYRAMLSSGETSLINRLVDEIVNEDIGEEEAKKQ